MKKALIWIAGALVLVLLSQMLFISKIDKTIVEETYQYCKKNGYSTDYCFFVDFSKPSGINRFFIYSFKEKKIIHRSLCAQGLGPNYNIFTSKFSNKIGSNYSSLGKYRVGALRKMYSAQWCDPKGYNLYGLDSTNSNALARGILIHNGNPEIQTFPPTLPARQPRLLRRFQFHDGTHQKHQEENPETHSALRLQITGKRKEKSERRNQKGEICE